MKKRLDPEIIVSGGAIYWTNIEQIKIVSCIIQPVGQWLSLAGHVMLCNLVVNNHGRLSSKSPTDG